MVYLLIQSQTINNRLLGEAGLDSRHTTQLRLSQIPTSWVHWYHSTLTTISIEHWNHQETDQHNDVTRQEMVLVDLSTISSISLQFKSQLTEVPAGGNTFYGQAALEQCDADRARKQLDSSDAVFHAR